MKKKVKLFFLAIIILFPIVTSGQNGVIIKGIVTDHTGNPLIDANISISSESYGSSTDKNGEYIFKLPDDHTGREVVLEIRYVGFVTQFVKIKLVSGNNLYNFRMEKDVLSIRPVIVTAQRREEKLQNVPISITTLDNKEIKSRGLNKVSDLQFSIPNFFFGDGGFNYNNPSSIRGISGSSRASGVEARANYYIDDVYMGRSVAVNQELFDLERIELLKGPQGTLFGKNTVSGVINITTRKPFNGWEGTASFDAGNYSYLNTNFIINAPLKDNKLFARFSGKIMKRNGFVTNLFNNKDYNRQNIMNGRLQLRYLPSQNFDIILSLNALRDRRPQRIVGIALDGPGYDAAPGPREVSHNLDEFENRDIFGASLNMVYQFSNNYSIKSITGFRKIKNWGNLDEDLSPKTLVVDNFKNEDTHFTQEFRLISPVLKRFNFVTGLFYFYQSSDFMFDLKTSSDNPLPNFSLLSEGPVKSNSIAGYFHGNLNITNNLSLIGGLRYTYEYKKVNWDQMNNLGLYLNLENYTDTYSKGVFSPQIGLRYNPLDQLMLYAKISWGYKSGGWGNFTVWKIEDLKLRPEYSVSYEAGTKFTTLNNKLRFNAAAFLNKFDDFQTEIWKDVPPPFTTPETLPVYTNAAEVTSKGIELELIAAPLNNLSIFSSLGYVDATYDEFIIPSERNYNGHKLEFAPETEYNFSLEYTIPVTHVGTFVIRGDYIHKDDYYFDASNTEDFHIDGYELIDGKIGYESYDGTFGIYLWGKNLLDKLYMLTRAIFPQPVKYALYGMPRTFGIQVTYSFLNL